MKLIICGVAMLMLAAASTGAQTDLGGKSELTVWGGFSPDSTTAIRAFGRTPDARFGMVALRYSRRFNNGNSVNLKYTGDIIPVAILNFPDTQPIPAIRKTSYAFGITPFGVAANFRPRKKYQPFVDLSGGFMFFDKQIPNALGTKFHFTAALGGGLEIRLADKRAITAGYKYFHISNGQRGQINPGVDNNLFFVGYTFFSK